MKPAAFKATFSDMKLIKTRGVVQVIFEIPQADFDGAYEVLGGLPNPAAERWFGIAAINGSLPQEAHAAPRQEASSPQPDGAKREWRDLQPPQQAGIRSNEVAFEVFLKEKHPDDWREAADVADCIRIICGVHSRAELATKHAARVIWHQLDSEYQAWMRVS